MRLDLREDLPRIRAHFAERIRAQEAFSEPISAVEVPFRLDQACLVGLHFDTRAQHARDGTCYEVWDDAALELPRWGEAFEASDDQDLSFVLLTGETHTMPAGTGEAVAAVFGETLLAVVRDALAAGRFASLPLRDDCQLEAEEFDGSWAWPDEPFASEATDRPNEIRHLPPVRLPA